MHIMLPPYIDEFLDRKITDQLILTGPDSPSYAAWFDNSTPTTDLDPVYKSFYLWHITNPLEALAGEPLRAEERGPYVYRVYNHRFNVTFHNNNCTVRYRTWTYYVFQPDKSAPDVNDQHDQITTMNSIFLGAVAKLSGTEFGRDWLVTWFHNGDDRDRLFVSRTAYELIWGYNTAIGEVSGYAGNNYTSLDEAYATTGYDEISTGACDHGGESMHQYTMYQNSKMMEVCTQPYYPIALCPSSAAIPAWGSDEANRIHGGDGSQFHRHISPSSHLPTFLPGFRVLNFIYSGQHQRFRGIDVLPFIIDPIDLLNTSASHNASAAYYAGSLSGLWNVSLSADTIPMFASKPHFLDVQGIDEDENRTRIAAPDRSLHDTILLIEPYTGTVFSAHIRIQFSVHITPLTYNNTITKETVHWFSQLRTTLVPLFWTETFASANEKDCQLFIADVYFLESLSTFVYWFAFANGISCATLVIIHAIIITRRMLKYRHVIKGLHSALLDPTADSFDPTKKSDLDDWSDSDSDYDDDDLSDSDSGSDYSAGSTTSQGSGNSSHSSQGNNKTTATGVQYIPTAPIATSPSGLVTPYSVASSSGTSTPSINPTLPVTAYPQGTILRPSSRGSTSSYASQSTSPSINSSVPIITRVSIQPEPASRGTITYVSRSPSRSPSPSPSSPRSDGSSGTHSSTSNSRISQDALESHHHRKAARMAEVFSGTTPTSTSHGRHGRRASASSTSSANSIQSPSSPTPPNGSNPSAPHTTTSPDITFESTPDSMALATVTSTTRTRTRSRSLPESPDQRMLIRFLSRQQTSNSSTPTSSSERTTSMAIYNAAPPPYSIASITPAPAASNALVRSVSASATSASASTSMPPLSIPSALPPRVPPSRGMRLVDVPSEPPPTYVVSHDPVMPSPLQSQSQPQRSQAVRFAVPSPSPSPSPSPPPASVSDPPTSTGLSPPSPADCRIA